MFYDYHVHTYYSDDSCYPMKSVISDAIKKGIKEIAITDHVDYGVKLDHDVITGTKSTDKMFNVNYPLFYNEITKLQKKFKNEIEIKIGMEFGVQTHTINDFEKLFAKYPFDFIILSCHQSGNKEFWNQEFQKNKSQKEYNEGYYAEIQAVIKRYKNYSVLGHLDLINRYDKMGIYPFQNVRDTIADILKAIIEQGKGIEVNTSSFRYGLDDLTPSKAILELYKDLGGKILTFGSDSHEPSHLGAYINDVMETVKAMGFKHYCTYNKMQPIFHSF